MSVIRRISLGLASISLAALVAACGGAQQPGTPEHDLTPGTPATGGEAPGTPGGWPSQGTTENPGSLPGGDNPGGANPPPQPPPPDLLQGQ